MKFLCLAYGGCANGADGGSAGLLAPEPGHDRTTPALLRRPSALVSGAGVAAEVLTVSNWDGEIALQERALARHPLPLTAFAVVDASSLSEALSLAASTSCARAGGFVEVRALVHAPEVPAWQDTSREPALYVEP